MVQYLRRAEVTGTMRPGYEVIGGWAKAVGVEVRSNAEAFRAAMNGGPGTEPFQADDEVHPNARGQKLLADLFESIVKDAIVRAGKGKEQPGAGARAAPQSGR